MSSQKPQTVKIRMALDTCHSDDLAQWNWSGFVKRRIETTYGFQNMYHGIHTRHMFAYKLLCTHIVHTCSYISLDSVGAVVSCVCCVPAVVARTRFSLTCSHACNMSAFSTQREHAIPAVHRYGALKGYGGASARRVRACMSRQADCEGWHIINS